MGENVSIYASFGLVRQQMEGVYITRMIRIVFFPRFAFNVHPSHFNEARTQWPL